MNDSIKLNKDGTPRKLGSGRTKGSISLITVTLKDLTKYLPADAPVVIGVKWAQSVGLNVSLPEQAKPVIAATVDAPVVKEAEMAISFAEVDLDA